MNTAEFVLASFRAFNVNAISRLAYDFSQNYIIFILIACLIITIYLRLKSEIVMSDAEEQNIL